MTWADILMTKTPAQLRKCEWPYSCAFAKPIFCTRVYKIGSVVFLAFLTKSISGCSRSCRWDIWSHVPAPPHYPILLLCTLTVLYFYCLQTNDLLCQLEILNKGLGRCLLAEFDLVGGRVGDQDDGEGLAAVVKEFPTALVALSHEDMTGLLSTVSYILKFEFMHTECLHPS